jgi:hypothetical protein
MDPKVINIAAEIIRASSRECPADRAVREALASRRVPTSEQTWEISRAVFSYFRWFGWLDRERPLPGQIKYAVELAQAFKDRPESFSDQKLVDRSVPDWVRGEIEVTPAWVRAIQAEPRLWLRAKRGQGWQAGLPARPLAFVARNPGVDAVGKPRSGRQDAASTAGRRPAATSVAAFAAKVFSLADSLAPPGPRRAGSGAFR